LQVPVKPMLTRKTRILSLRQVRANHPLGYGGSYIWFEACKAAVLEADWTTMQERLQSAENAIKERQRELSMDHGGTREEGKR
jgi:cytochrome c biogenesis protein ResB